ISGDTVTVNGAGPVTIRASQPGDATYKAAPNVDRSFVVNKAPATITLGDLNHTYDGAAKSATAATEPAGLSGVAFSYSQNGAAVASPTAVGSYTVTVTLNNDNYQAADSTGTLVISKTGQTITFNPLPNKAYGDPAFGLNATSSSGLPVSFKLVSGPATVNGNTVTLTGVGTVTIRASQAGGADFNAAAHVDRSFLVNKGQATLTLGGLSHIYNGLAKRATVATSPAGLTGVTISYSQNGVPVTAPVNAGSYVVRASLSNSKYQAAVVTATLVVAKSGQTISFAPLASRAYGSGSFNVAATTSSRLPVIFRIVSGPARISGTTVTVTGVGTVVIRASQPGNANYNAAAYVDRSFAATKAAQTITFDLLPSKTYGEAPFALSATSSSGMPVTFQLVSGPATLAGNKLTLTGAGKVTARATQAGNINYNAAPAVARVFDVTSAHPNIALRNLAFAYDGTIKAATVLTQPAGLKFTVGYSQNGVAVTPLKAGSYKVVATINDATYRGTITGTLVINKARPVITWANPATVAPGTVLGAAQLNATANVPGTFKYAPAAGLVMGAGAYQLSVTFTPKDAVNYAAVTKTVKLTASPTATARALSPDIGYLAISTAEPAATLARFANVRGIFSVPFSLLPGS
ncbi:MAG TPA: MBG domain-containing protein, partial [Pyrinomonadaceae bacterium]|nr:MBG domain-containing protein [Pyrinomonadaceae bacterium]